VVTPPTNVERALALAMILMLTACDAENPREQAGAGPSSAAAPASTPTAVPTTSQAVTPCADARIAFGPVHKSSVLTAVAPAVTIASRSGGRLKTALRPVRRYRAEVVAEGDAPHADIYRSFISSFDEVTAPTAGLGEVAPVEPGTMTMRGPGRFVQYEGVLAVEATFSYSCGATTDRGTVSSWLIPISGVLSCDRKPQPREPIHAQAIALACLDRSASRR
jgi:hypothetical protein